MAEEKEEKKAEEKEEVKKPVPFGTTKKIEAESWVKAALTKFQRVIYCGKYVCFLKTNKYCLLTYTIYIF